MGDTTFTYQGKDGAELFCYRWFPEDEASVKAIVQIAHGLAEHAARYERLAKALNAAGFGVYASDHRGHGKSFQGEENMGFFAEKDGWNVVIGDMHSLNRHISKEHPGQSIYLIGHSMGSLLGQSYIIKHSDTIQGVLLSASTDSAGILRYAGILAAKIERMRLGKKGRSKILNAMSFGDFNNAFKPVRTEFDWLSRDPEEVDKYINDPLCGFIATNQLWLDLLGGLGSMAKPSERAKIRKELPICLITGSKDPVTRASKGVVGLDKCYKKAGVKDVTVKIYPDGRHESFNETNRDEVTQDVINWLERIHG